MATGRSPVTDLILAQHLRETTAETRENQARAIAAEHAREIAESAIGSVYRVTSRTSAGIVYTVSLSRETCECKDHQHTGGTTCIHLLAAEMVKARSATCADCNQRHLRRDLYEVGDDHLTFFEGDELCRTCALGSGVL
jgi:hypothetical protein